MIVNIWFVIVDFAKSCRHKINQRRKMMLTVAMVLEFLDLKVILDLKHQLRTPI